ncbi:FUSC family protein, partial [Streptacidiphilus monticola]
MSRSPLPPVLRLARPAEAWFKPALSVVIAGAVPDFVLLGIGRLDLVMFTMAGSLCALFGHQLPYAARARAIPGVVLGMTAGLALALLAGAATSSVPLLVLVGAALAAVQKTLVDATRIGPPGHVIFVFVSSGALFVHQPAQLIPGHLALTLGAGLIAWAVTLAPALLRPHGPERRATARALA